MGPETETTQREPQDVTQFRQQTVQPFLENLFQAPGGAQNPFAQLAAQNPAQQVLDQIGGDLQSLIGGGGFGAGQQVVEAAQPVFQRNLQEAGSQFLAQTPSTFNTAAGAGLGNLQGRALQDFNRFQAQALQQGQQTALGAARTLGGLGQGAAQAQEGLFVNPTLQLLLGGIQQTQPIPAGVSQTQSPFQQITGGIGDLFG